MSGEKKRPQFTDPYEAAKVSSFMAEVEVGRWKTMFFEIDHEHHAVSMVAAMVHGGEQKDMRLARTIPPGRYMTLLRKATEQETQDIEDERLVDSEAPLPGYIPIMSDTPTEIREHAHAIENAHGKVLITGLGLGAIVSALLAKPEVEHITVVEIDRDVIAITGPYYEDEPRVTIVNADALTFASYARPNPGEAFGPTTWDYHWADIWSHIADRNLEDDSVAEHGISYGTMFKAYGPLCDEQMAWGYAEALEMVTVKNRERERINQWARDFIAADDATRLDMLVEFHIRRQTPQLQPDQPIPDAVRNFFEKEFKVRENCQLQLEQTDMAADLQKLLDVEEEDPDPMARPNEHPEANVA